MGGLHTWLWRLPGRRSGPPCPPRCHRPPRHQRAECGRRSRPQTEPRWAATEPACPTRHPRTSPSPAARPQLCPQSTPNKHRAGTLTLSSSASMLKFISAILSNGALKEQLTLRTSLRRPVPVGDTTSQRTVSHDAPRGRPGGPGREGEVTLHGDLRASAAQSGARMSPGAIGRRHTCTPHRGHLLSLHLQIKEPGADPTHAVSALHKCPPAFPEDVCASKTTASPALPQWLRVAGHT